MRKHSSLARREFLLSEIDSNFDFKKCTYWYPSNQSNALQKLQRQMKNIDAVVEVRDSRIPLSSINPKFSKLLSARPRLVVYNKADLTDKTFNRKELKEALKAHTSDAIIFTEAISNTNIRDIRAWAMNLCSNYPHLYPHITMVVVGLPNVGKSTIINNLRSIYGIGEKVLKVGALPGVTRSVHTKVKISNSPLVYLVDTPGIFEPHLVHPVNALKLAVTGAIKEDHVDMLAAAEYLLYRLNLIPENVRKYNKRYHLFGKTTIDVLLETIARNNAYLKGSKQHAISTISDLGCDFKDRLLFSYSDLKSAQNRTNLDTSMAAAKFIRDYRNGHLGKISFDECSREFIEKSLLLAND